ncbi:MAG: OsmC family protein [Candidatus Limnocylindrales bacterium]
MTKHLTVRWHGELDFDASDAAGAIVPMSSKDDVFGPSQLVLAALGGCTGMDAVSVMRKKKVAFESYRVEVTGEQREAYPKAYTRIVVEHIVDGRGISDQAVSRAIELSARKYCMVGATIATGDCSINHRMRVTDEAGERTCDCITIGPRGAGLSHYESS